MDKSIQKLHQSIEQLRDILTGRKTYNNDTECLDNAIATFEELDEQFYDVIVDMDKYFDKVISGIKNKHELTPPK